MFFTNFHPMTSEEVNKKVIASPKAETKLESTPLLSGKEINFNFEGEHKPEKLSYKFNSSFTLDINENGNEFKDVPYNALSLNERIVLFTHLIPGTSRGWHIIVDLQSGLATAFETWFGISVPVGGDLTGQRPPSHHREIPREVQRQYHFGWVDAGRDKPEKLHTTTNRLEGKGLYWKNNEGNRWLSFFPSVVCSTTVHLDAPRDTTIITYPSDYIRISEKYYIYAKWGVEFGGEMHLYVLDIGELKAIGFKFGFNDKDDFEYNMYSAELVITGDAAHLEKIGDGGDKEAPMPMVLARGKGGRYAYRPRDVDVPLTKEEVIEAVKTKRIFESGGSNIMMSSNRLPFSYDLVGKPFSLNFDHVETPFAWSAGNMPEKLITNYEYEFIDKEKLKWREAGGSWQEEKYTCFNPAKGIYFFSHMLTGHSQYASVAQAVDISTGLATCIFARIGSWRSDWEAGCTCLFGTAKGEGIAKPHFSQRHGFTNDLLGHSYAWAYSDSSASIHVYGAPRSYSWSIFQPNNSGGATWSSPGFFIKLREDAYLLQWIEENCNGGHSIVCFNPRIMQDSGFFYNVNKHTGLGLNIFGGHARKLGSFDIAKYF